MFCRSVSKRIEVNVSLYSFAVLFCPWYLASPNAIALRLLMCSIVYCAYWVKFCFIARVGVEVVTFAGSYFITESVLNYFYFCFADQALF